MTIDLTNQNQNQDNQNQNQDNQNQQVKTFTQEEVDKMLQAETDRKVSSALNTAKTKWEQEFEEKLKQEKSEAEKLAKMNEEERMKLELDKQKQAFEDERKQFMREKLEMETLKELASNNLPTSFAKYLVAEKEEHITENVKNFQKHWNEAIEEEVNRKLAGNTPKISTQSNADNVTKDQYRKMTYEERMELKIKNKDLYDQLKG